MTPAQQRIYTAAVIEDKGGDSSKPSISYSYVDKSRRKIVQNITSTAKEHWILPTIASLHWDLKIFPEEQLITVIIGTQPKTKLLGSPIYQLSRERQAGAKIDNLITELLQSWNLLYFEYC